MTYKPIVVRVGEAPDVVSFLAERIYEFNSKATGYVDGEAFTSVQPDESGAIRAGISGYTWGGCGYVSYLWVAESARKRGLGSALLSAAEEHARKRGCSVVFLATHSFQAPAFYERRGYKAEAVVRDHPVGHANVIYAKRLHDDAGHVSHEHRY